MAGSKQCERWKQWRECAGFSSQSALARKLCVDPAMICRLENGKGGLSLGLFLRLCRVLNLSRRETLEALALCAGEPAPESWHLLEAA